ncbi:type II toxin-antitoxin system RelE/ParE family toxin [Brunnivagina elsteri]|uniref:Plasmid stabilization system protein n=1 Tax=Brunnivagina elsteri CCALA 953 TaxID=987040 RepID=A0A2A2TD74_9CYAN|nr:type II toxin-antitoxin system RelE/ParE family toxin [Calothrix elsteri]PAX51747.1 plasmid stabilization system protein [Calothrix elsteri CCALA 953]
MTYKVEISPTAVADIEQIFLWMREYSVDAAHRWVRGCYEIMLTLEKFPNRCPMSPESEYMGIEVRQLLYKKQFRILFTVSETVQEGGGIVRIHRVRHGSQESLRHPEQLLDDDDE